MNLIRYANLAIISLLVPSVLAQASCGRSIGTGGLTPPPIDTGSPDVQVVFDLGTVDQGSDPGASDVGVPTPDAPLDVLTPDLANEVFNGVLCEANVIIETEDQLAAFEGCTELFGDLTIQGPLITALSGLATVEVIRDNLLIVNTGLSNLSGAINLTEVKGDLILLDNSVLAELDGMSKLQRVGGDIRVENNTGLLQINGFLALTDVVGCLRIENQPKLLGVDGLWNLQSVGSCGGHAFHVDVGDSLSSVDFPSLVTITGAGVSQISGVALMTVNLPMLSTIEGDLHISPGPKFTFLFAQSLQQIQGDVRIFDNSIAGFTLQNLTQIGGDLVVENTTLLTDFGFDNLVSIGGDLLLDSNAALTNLDGLIKLTSLGGNLVLQDNDALFDLVGLSSLTSISGLIVANGNQQLKQCDLDALAVTLGVACQCSGNNLSACP